MADRVTVSGANEQEDGSHGIEVTSSVDDILNITSSASCDDEEKNGDAPWTPSPGRKSPLLSQLFFGRNDNGQPRRPKKNDDAFSSSSEEEDSGDEESAIVEGAESTDEEKKKDEGDGSTMNREESVATSPTGETTPNQSEWDKALKTGKPSTGHVTDLSFSKVTPARPGTRTASVHGDPPVHTPLRSPPNIRKKSSLPEEDMVGPLSSYQPPQTGPGPSVSARSNHSQSTTTTTTSFAASGRTSSGPASATATLPTFPPRQPSVVSTSSSTLLSGAGTAISPVRPDPSENDHLSAGVLPDVLMTMRQKIESMTLFDSDIMRLAASQVDDDDDPEAQETRESLKRSSQQSISAAVLVSLAHKRYERRRLAAMEIEKVVRSLVQQKRPESLERVRAILLLLSDDYVRSTNEDARKGGVVALAGVAIGLKKAPEAEAAECRDLILASVVHACQDHSVRVRYYATESLFNVVKVIPALAIQHFFILFEILRSLFADVDPDVRSGAELLDKKLKEIIVGAMNSGIFTAEACVPVFARFVHMRNKATKRLTLTWLQELNEKLIGAPILEFLHLFLGGIFDMVADPTVAIRQSALAFLQSVLPKLLVVNSEAIDDMDNEGMHVNFDKILQSLVTTMEHANPFVRKVAMYWMSRIVRAHMGVDEQQQQQTAPHGSDFSSPRTMAPNGSVSPIMSPADGAVTTSADGKHLSAATLSVRNSVPHVLPGILLSIGDNFQSSGATKEGFLPDQTTRSLAEQTNACLQDAVRRDGQAYVQHLDGFIVALREELDSPGGAASKNPPAIQRTPYRMDVAQDGTGIETPGWFRGSSDMKEKNDEAMVMSRLCALQWVIVLYESVVPDELKADYAREFVFPIIHQLADRPPETIVYKSLEALAKITVPVSGEDHSRRLSSGSLSGLDSPTWAVPTGSGSEGSLAEFPMTESNVTYALNILDPTRRQLKSRDREVFSALLQLHSHNEALLANLSNVITYMCKLQPPEFVMVSFAVELDLFIKRRQHMSHVLLNADEAKDLRDALKDCVASKGSSDSDRQKSCLFHILLHSFSHNIAATLSLCLWAGAYRTASIILNRIDPLDINLMFLLEIDRLIELLERPLFRHLHVRMLEGDNQSREEGSGAMLFQLLKSLLMILPQSTCYRVLRERLTSVSRFRQSTIPPEPKNRFGTRRPKLLQGDTKVYVSRVSVVRRLHCDATWQTIRHESLEMQKREQENFVAGSDRRRWLGYASKEEEMEAASKFRKEKSRANKGGFSIEEEKNEYHDFDTLADDGPKMNYVPNEETADITERAPETAPEEQEATREGEAGWKTFWADNNEGS